MGCLFKTCRTKVWVPMPQSKNLIFLTITLNELWLSKNRENLNKSMENRWKNQKKLNEEKILKYRVLDISTPILCWGPLTLEILRIYILVIYLDILNFGHDFSKLLSCMSSHTWENIMLVLKWVVTLTYGLDPRVIIYFLLIGWLLIKVCDNIYS